MYLEDNLKKRGEPMKITEMNILQLIEERDGAMGSRELAVALGIEHGITAKVIPTLKRMEQKGLLINADPAGRCGLNPAEADALRTAVERLPSALSFWLLRKNIS
jgi:hypothetical protein